MFGGWKLYRKITTLMKQFRKSLHRTEKTSSRGTSVMMFTQIQKSIQNAAIVK